MDNMLFSTNYMMGIRESLKRPSTFLLNRYFPFIQTETSEEIHFDVIDRTRRLAPFVSPVVAGKVVQASGHTTKTFKPAYIKAKTPWDPNRPLKRAAGESIGGAMSPMERLEMLMVQTMIEHDEMVFRRMEVMASEALRAGTVTVQGDDYPTQVVDFGRQAALTKTLTSGDRWGEMGVSPLGDINRWALEALQASGAKPVDVTLDIDAWNLLIADEAFKTRLDTRWVDNAVMSLGGPNAQGGTYMGTVDGFNFFVYADWYIDPADGQEKPILPSHTVILSGQALEGAQAFGAIRDEAAGYQALPIFPKSWVEQDPAVRYVMSQSAPLVVPTRVNHSLCVTVR